MKKKYIIILLVSIFLNVSAYFGYTYYLNYQLERKMVTMNFLKMDALLFAIRAYHTNIGILPESLRELYANPRETKYWEPSNDVWGNSFVFNYIDKNTAIVKCLGKDGKEGGEGINGDWVYKFSVKYDDQHKHIDLIEEVVSIPSKAEFYFDSKYPNIRKHGAKTTKN
jgi:hypothetical protein